MSMSCPLRTGGSSQRVLSDNFVLSNIFSQVHNFNFGAKLMLEESQRKYTTKIWGKVKGCCDSAFTDKKGSIGQNSVSVPSYFWKIIW